MAGITLKLGDGFPKVKPERSTSVKELQLLLKTWGYPITDSGHFDWATDEAVVHFQKNVLKIAPDAKVRVESGTTWKALKGAPSAVLPGVSFVPDLTYPVPFIHQFDKIHLEKPGKEACFDAAVTILRSVGIVQTGPYEAFKIITAETWKNGIPIHTINENNLRDGLKYLDEQLSKGFAVMAGVSYEASSHNEGITEHFVIIYEKTAEGSYFFHDPATTNKSNGAGRLFTMDPTSKNLTAAGISGYPTAAIGARYYMTQIRKNVK